MLAFQENMLTLTGAKCVVEATKMGTWTYVPRIEKAINKSYEPDCLVQFHA